MKGIKSLPSWCLHLTSWYCLHARYHAAALEHTKNTSSPWSLQVSGIHNKNTYKDNIRQEVICVIDRKRDDFHGGEGSKRQERHSFSCPIQHFQILPTYYLALQVYPDTWYVKTKVTTCISRIYFGDSSDKAASKFIMNAKQVNAGENTV